MGKIIRIFFERDFKDEVAEAMKTAFKIDGTKKTSNYLGIDDGYAREIANVRGVPLGNLERCTKALGMTTNGFHNNYYAIVVPRAYTQRFNIPEDGLKVFSCRDIGDDRTATNYFESELFDVDNNLYRNVLRYWRHHVYNGRTTILEMCDITGLSDRTIINARHINLNPRCSTIQKLLGVYGCRLVIVKFPREFRLKHVKIKY